MSVTNACMGERKDGDRRSGCSLVQDFGLEAKVQMLLLKRSNMFSLVSLGLNSDPRRISTSSFKPILLLVLDWLKHVYIFEGIQVFASSSFFNLMQMIGWSLNN